jgi:hypothetical protein
VASPSKAIVPSISIYERLRQYRRYLQEQEDVKTDLLPATYATAEDAHATQRQRRADIAAIMEAVRQGEERRAQGTARTTRATIPRQSHPDYTITDETGVYDTRTPYSAVKYEQPRTSAQTRSRNTTTQPPVTRRASTTEQPRQTTTLDAAQYRRRLRLSRSLVALGILALIVIFMAMGAIIAPALGGTIQNISNRITYGDPPTTRYDVFLGHYRHDTSHLEASNQGGKIYISERGNGVVLAPKLYYVVTVTGPDAGSYPVTLIFVDLNHDGKLDMLVNVKGFQIPMYNTGTSFVGHL